VARQRVSLAPLLGTNSRRVSDKALQGTFMRGGYNVELRDGEWWSRLGEGRVANGTVRIASTPWWWALDVNRDLTIIANPFWALALSSGTSLDAVYAPAVTESVTYTNGSANATSSTTRVVDQLMLVNGVNGAYRVVSRVGTALVMDRPFEGTTGAKSTKFIDPLVRDTAGTAVTYATSSMTPQLGSCFVFEQLVTNSATAIHASSPATTSGSFYLIITSNLGCPVAIDLSGYLAGSPANPLRRWFFNTALSSPAIVGSDTTSDSLKDIGVFGGVYKGRMFIGPAADPNGKYGSRTLWWSQIGDFCRWHTGIAGQTAAPNFKTFDGEGNGIAGIANLQDDLAIHRDDTQVVCTATQSLAQPFTFRENNQGLGVRSRGRSNRIVSANGVNYFWAQQGLAVFDGRGVQLIAQDAADALRSHRFIEDFRPVTHVLHDATRRRLYWFKAEGSRHQDALPATATVTYTSGDQVQNYSPVFVYDYANDAYWFEDRPTTYGGGMVGRTEGNLLYLSRLDGTLVTAYGSNSAAGDASHLTPETTGNAVTVNCQVETPWIDFGNFAAKRLVEVETVERSIMAGNGNFDDEIENGISGTYFWLRCRVFVDLNDATTKADVGVVYDSSNSQLTDLAEFRQSPTFVRTFTPRADGRQFKLRFSNALSSAATTAGYLQAPFRISDIICEYAQKESTLPLTTLTSASISE